MHDGIPINLTFCSVPHLKLFGNLSWALAGVCGFLAEEFCFRRVCVFQNFLLLSTCFCLWIKILLLFLEDMT